jgi:hypothetical protein
MMFLQLLATPNEFSATCKTVSFQNSGNTEHQQNKTPTKQKIITASMQPTPAPRGLDLRVLAPRVARVRSNPEC